MTTVTRRIRMMIGDDGNGVYGDDEDSLYTSAPNWQWWSRREVLVCGYRRDLQTRKTAGCCCKVVYHFHGFSLSIVSLTPFYMNPVAFNPTTEPANVMPKLILSTHACTVPCTMAYCRTCLRYICSPSLTALQIWLNWSGCPGQCCLC